ncbi:hypothetical protein LWP59_35235 [Amycolatopsis acidiphila]|uniref:Uncharacterized protein n=1 Tax=Amycolatopsis acidiphila TaxID=715473 RepID=A0A558AJV7_9PSEU|nr:hypothetical protein [Amycolatopsis acidiphila]TVT24543.1 hypothetical protein FNH06_06110 [Amycolatopsis acidiphila]UIJ59245.1 hypothetical protein LWP59_35235 [Amycolatopsis acidiphila]GHG79314.1 hypothetical protein GCM10017788_47350 [Amycolatopsis acidiphila]
MRAVTPAAWSAVLLAWLGVHLATGTPLAELAQWALAVGLGVLLPGFALVRAARATAAPLLEDLAWGTVAGCLVAMLGWALDVVLPWAPPPWLVGPVFALVLLAFPRTRRRVLARPAPGWGVAANLWLTGALAVAVAWMTTDYLRFTPLDPGPGGRTYYYDTTFQVAVMGELRHTLWPGYPLVHGDPYSYHWFLHAITAHLTTGTGVDPFDSMLRLVPTTLFPAVVLLAAVVARRVADSVRAGVVCAGLLTVTGATVATVWSTDGQAPLMIQSYWVSSLTSAFGWLPTVAVAGCVVAILRRSTADRAVPVALFVPLVLLATGAKSADLAVLLGGTVLAFFALLFRRKWMVVPRAIAVNVFLGGVLLIARFTMYGGGDYGLQVSPLGPIRQTAGQTFPDAVRPSGGDLYLALPHVPLAPLFAAAVLYLVPLLPRLAGFVPLLRRRPLDPAMWVFLGTTIAGFGAMLVFRQPGNSNIYFLVAAYPVGLIGSAWGVAQLRWTRTAVAGGAGIGLVLTLAIAWVAGARPAKSITGWLLPLAALAAALLLLALGRRRSTGVVLTFALLGTGLLSTGLYLTQTSTRPSYNLGVTYADATSLPVTRDELAAGRWLDAHAGPTDVLAVNRVCTQQSPGECTAKLFDMGAFAQRNVDVEGWAYSQRNLDAAWHSTVWYADQPFWDQRRLDEELSAFRTPTPAALAALSARGVRWLVADTRAPVDVGALDALAPRALTLPTVLVWRL